MVSWLREFWLCLVNFYEELSQQRSFFIVKQSLVPSSTFFAWPSQRIKSFSPYCLCPVFALRVELSDLGIATGASGFWFLDFVTASPAGKANLSTLRPRPFSKPPATIRMTTSPHKAIHKDKLTWTTAASGRYNFPLVPVRSYQHPTKEERKRRRAKGRMVIYHTPMLAEIADP